MWNNGNSNSIATIIILYNFNTRIKVVRKIKIFQIIDNFNLKQKVPSRNMKHLFACLWSLLWSSCHSHDDHNGGDDDDDD